VAALAGMPGAARQVGWALSALAGDDDVPWHRVVNAKGEISPRGVREFGDLQRALLEAEGVDFDARGRIDLARHAWKPETRGGVSAAKKRKDPELMRDRTARERGVANAANAKRKTR
jgi:methylated-DNA-protein-cysteine methyltransferase-like protein